MCNPRICYKVHSLLYSNIYLCMTATVALCKFYLVCTLEYPARKRAIIYLTVHLKIT